jgi:hypothetical protein
VLSAKTELRNFIDKSSSVPNSHSALSTQHSALLQDRGEVSGSNGTVTGAGTVGSMRGSSGGSSIGRGGCGGSNGSGCGSSGWTGSGTSGSGTGSSGTPGLFSAVSFISFTDDQAGPVKRRSIASRILARLSCANSSSLFSMPCASSARPSSLMRVRNQFEYSPL